MKDENFYFVISRVWPSGGMCIYTYGSEIQHGTMAQAESLLEHIRRQTRLSNEKDNRSDLGKRLFPDSKPNFVDPMSYRIYKVNFEPVD